MKSAGTFTLRLFTVALAVVLIVGLGFAWKNSPAADLVANRQRDRGAQIDRGLALSRPRDEQRNRGNLGVSFGRIDDVAQTLFIEGLILLGVVLIDRQRRLRRRPFAASADAP